MMSILEQKYMPCIITVSNWR